MATQVSHVIYPWEERITGMVVVTLAARPTSEPYLMLFVFYQARWYGWTLGLSLLWAGTVESSLP